MIFFLFFSLFSSIHTDCIEFNQASRINRCFIINSEQSQDNFEHYYPQCLQCTIETYIEPEGIQWEEENQCSMIELQCIQLKFPTVEIFEDFFQYYQRFLLGLFFKDNGTDQNTLHVIIQKNSFEEINAKYIKRILYLDYSAYRVFFLEIHLHNKIIRINRDLINLTYLSIKLILVCGDITQRQETIYIIYNRNIILESQSNPCSVMLIPPTEIIPITSTLSITTMEIKILPVSKNNSKDIVLIIILFTSILLSLCIGMALYCWKRLKHRYQRFTKRIETISEDSFSQDEISLTSMTDEPKSNLKLKQTNHGIRALQFLDDDI